MSTDRTSAQSSATNKAGPLTETGPQIGLHGLGDELVQLAPSASTGSYPASGAMPATGASSAKLRRIKAEGRDLVSRSAAARPGR